MGKKERALRERVLEALGEYDDHDVMSGPSYREGELNGTIFLLRRDLETVSAREAEANEQVGVLERTNASVRRDLSIVTERWKAADRRVDDWKESVRAAIEALEGVRVPLPLPTPAGRRAGDGAWTAGVHSALRLLRGMK